MRFTLSGDGHPRATFHVIHRLVRGDVAFALAVRFSEMTPDEAAPRLREIGSRETQSIVRDLLEVYGPPGAWPDLSEHDGSELMSLADAAVERLWPEA